MRQERMLCRDCPELMAEVAQFINAMKCTAFSGERAMDEAAWLSATDPTEMLSYLSRSGASTRKVRLFAVACCRRYVSILDDPRSRNGLLVAEHWADGLLSTAYIENAKAQAEAAARDVPSSATRSVVWTLDNDPWLAAFELARHTPTMIQVQFLHDIFGNPFRRVNVREPLLSWNDHTVVRLAQSIYESRDFTGLPIVADALEDAGCTDHDILTHCRQGENHVKGCWVVDLLTGHRDENVKGIVHAQERFLHLSMQMLQTLPNGWHWAQTDDALQNAILSLHRALSDLAVQSSLHFWNLANLQIRRELLNLARHYQGPQGGAIRNHTDSGGKAAGDQAGRPHARGNRGPGEPQSLQEWTVFHQAVGSLPEEERELFGLLWYQGLTQDEAANMLGVSLRTVRRRWLSAKCLLFHTLEGPSPVDHL